MSFFLPLFFWCVFFFLAGQNMWIFRPMAFHGSQVDPRLRFDRATPSGGQRHRGGPLGPGRTEPEELGGVQRRSFASIWLKRIYVHICIYIYVYIYIYFSPLGFRGNRFHYWICFLVFFFQGAKRQWKCGFAFKPKDGVPPKRNKGGLGVWGFSLKQMRGTPSKGQAQIERAKSTWKFG